LASYRLADVATILVGCLIAQRAVRTLASVIGLPPPNDLAGVGEGPEPVLIQALVAQAPVEAFAVGILDRLAGVDEPQADVSLVSPLVEGPAGQLRPVVQHDLGRLSPALGHDPVKDTGDPRSWLDDTLRLDAFRDLLIADIKARYQPRSALAYPFGLTEPEKL
jgi:hypothetical protein